MLIGNYKANFFILTTELIGKLGTCVWFGVGSFRLAKPPIGTH